MRYTTCMVPGLSRSIHDIWHIPGAVMYRRNIAGFCYSGCVQRVCTADVLAWWFRFILYNIIQAFIIIVFILCEVIIYKYSFLTKENIIFRRECQNELAFLFVTMIRDYSDVPDCQKEASDELSPNEGFQFLCLELAEQ